MSLDRKTFVDLCLSGDALADEIDDYIDQWHGKGTGMSLHQFLGLSWPEYALWVERPDCLKYILYARKNSRVIAEDEVIPKLRIAARAVSPEDAEEMVAWLRETGRIKD